MSEALYPTPTRLALLRQVANSQVQSGDSDGVLLYPDAPDAWDNPQTVTARIYEMERSGWAVEANPGHPGSWWTPTVDGYAVLKAHPAVTS